MDPEARIAESVIPLSHRIAASGTGRLVRWGAALLLGGAVGNLIDRIRVGRVIDFLDFRVWPVFNLADIGICVGVACLIYALLRDGEKERE